MLELTNMDLKDLGILETRHRLKILAAIRQLAKYSESYMAEVYEIEEQMEK